MKIRGKTVFTILAAIVVLYSTSILITTRYFNKLEKAAQFGDAFGAVNALFSGLALAGVIYTLILQQKELQSQRREIMNTRAMNFVFNQLKIVDSVIDACEWFKILDNLEERNHKGIYAINRWKSFLASRTDVSEVILESKGSIERLFRCLANSTKMLLKIREIEEMDDDDSLFIFEFFKYNMDPRVWEFIYELNNIDKSKFSEEAKQYFEYGLGKVIEFDNLYRELNKKKENHH